MSEVTRRGESLNDHTFDSELLLPRGWGWILSMGDRQELRPLELKDELDQLEGVALASQTLALRAAR